MHGHIVELDSKTMTYEFAMPDGTYTIKMKPEAAYNGVIVFVIDIFDMFSDIADLDAVNVTIDSLKIL